MVDIYWSELLKWKSISKVKIDCKYRLKNHAILRKLFIVESTVIPKIDYITAENQSDIVNITANYLF